MMHILKICRFRILSSLVATLSFVLIWNGAARADNDLERAIVAGDDARVAALIERGEDVNQRTKPFSTPLLSLAAIRGETVIVNLLIDAGADANQTNSHGMSALSAAVRSCTGNLDVINGLLVAGADVDSRSGASLTPLLVAMQEERWDVARLLFENGADVNLLNSFGEGVLNYAIYYERNDLVNLALDEDVDRRQLRRLYGKGRHYHLNFGTPGASARSVFCRQS
jgi:ankyrin repeat protein